MIRPTQVVLALSLASAAVTLSGCAGASNIQSVKAEDYGKVPNQLLVVIPPQEHLGTRFKQTLTTSLAECGMTVRYRTDYTLAEATAGRFDAVMTSTPLETETTTVSSRYGYDTFASAVRFEFALIDIESRKNVWKEQIDFTNGNSLRLVSHEAAQEVWATALFDSMVKNGLVGRCASDRAVAVVADFESRSTPDAAALLTAKPVSVTFSVGGTRYATADEALAALRELDDAKLALANPVEAQPHAPLLMIIPSQQEIERSTANKIIGVPDEADIQRFNVGSRELLYDYYKRAFRKAGLFERIDTARSNEVQSGDFKGDRYKLWYAPSEGTGPGSWVLASAKGGEQRFQMPPNDQNELETMVIKVGAALEDLPR